MALFEDKKKPYNIYRKGGPEERMQRKMNIAALGAANQVAEITGSKVIADSYANLFKNVTKNAPAPLLTSTVMNKTIPTNKVSASTSQPAVMSPTKKKPLVGAASGIPNTGYVRREDTGETFTFDGSTFRAFDSSGNKITKTASPITMSPRSSFSKPLGGIDQDIQRKYDRAHQEQYMRRISGGGMVPLFGSAQRQEKKIKAPVTGSNWKERLAMKVADINAASEERQAMIRETGPVPMAQATRIENENSLFPIQKEMAQEHLKAAKILGSSLTEEEPEAIDLNAYMQEYFAKLKAKRQAQQ